MLSKTLLAAIGAGAFAVSACGVTGPAHTEPPPPQVDAIVEMQGVAFTPATIRIRAGGTVQWRNTSLVDHTVTADKGLAANPANVILPAGAQSFNSGEIDPGQVWTHTFTVPGTYRYVCLPHERQGMIGTVIVE
ncbi:MAG: cupredoxin domain-containing protein [Sphingomicrobium sp.]